MLLGEQGEPQTQHWGCRGTGGTPNPALGVQGCWVGQAEPTGDTSPSAREGREVQGLCAWDAGAALPGLQHPQTWLGPAHLAQVGGGNPGPVQEKRLDADPVPVQ